MFSSGASTAARLCQALGRTGEVTWFTQAYFAGREGVVEVGLHVRSRSTLRRTRVACTVP